MTGSLGPSAALAAGPSAGPSGGLAGCRAEFPALSMKVDGRPVVFLDGPGGTQVPRRVIDRVTRYLASENANTHGPFATSQATDRALDEARRTMAGFLGAAPDEIAFGQNMTTLNFALSRAIGRRLGPGDEILITDLDHEANRAPWLALEEKGVTVRAVRVDSQTCTLDLADLRSKLSAKTRVVAVSGASNAVGTVTDVKLVAALAREAALAAGSALAAPGADVIVVVDAVHLAPHRPIDVQDLGCDFLLCSAYKFFGPHVGVLYGRREAFGRLETYKVPPQSDAVPYRIETGTLMHEGIAGVTAAVEFMARLGGVAAIDGYEHGLAEWLRGELATIPGLTIYGPPPGHPRTPTISFRLEGWPPADLAEALAAEGVFAWAGDFYAATLLRRLGLADSGGLLRLGLAPYNTPAEMEQVALLLRRLASRR